MGENDKGENPGSASKVQLSTTGLRTIRTLVKSIEHLLAPHKQLKFCLFALYDHTLFVF